MGSEVYGDFDEDRERELVAFECDLFRGLAVERGILTVTLAALRWRGSLTAGILRGNLEPQPGKNVPAFPFVYVEHQVAALFARLQCPPPRPRLP